MENKIVATVTVCQQVGLDEFRDRRHSRVFAESCSFHDVLRWAEMITGKQETITSIQFSEYDGESVAGRDRTQPAHPEWPEVDTSMWDACNPGCDPEFNGSKSSSCTCPPAKAAMLKAREK